MPYLPVEGLLRRERSAATRRRRGSNTRLHDEQRLAREQRSRQKRRNAIVENHGVKTATPTVSGHGVRAGHGEGHGVLAVDRDVSEHSGVHARECEVATGLFNTSRAGISSKTSPDLQTELAVHDAS